MSGREDESYHAMMFDLANDGIDHSDYKSTEDCETPLHFDSTNNFQDNFRTPSNDTERHSQVRNPTSRLNPKTKNGKQQNDMISQAFRQANLDANEFIDALLGYKGSGFENQNENHVTDSLEALISSGQFTDNFGSTVDFDQSSKGSKWKNHDDEDNQDIHGGDTSNACDDDNLGINSPGSSQASQNYYDKPCSSNSGSPAAPTPAHTMIVQPTSPPLSSATTKEFTELETFHPPGDQDDGCIKSCSSYHEELDFTQTEPEYPTSQILPSTTYASGISVGPVPPQTILPSPIALPIVQTTVLADPLHASNHYSVDKVQLSNFLKANGRQVSGRKRKSKEEIERLIKRFCDPKELDYCTESKDLT